MGCSLVKSVFFVYCVMLVHVSDFLQVRCSSNERVVQQGLAAMQVQFACQFDLTDITLHLHSPLRSPLQSFFYNF